MNKTIVFTAIMLVFIATISLAGNYSAILLHEAKHKHIFKYGEIESTIIINYPFGESKTVPQDNNSTPKEILHDIMQAQMIVEATEPSLFFSIIQTTILFGILLEIILKP